MPFVPSGPSLGRFGSWAVYGVVLAARAGVATGRVWLAVNLVGLSTLVLLDQHRFQPRVYQFLLMGLVLAIALREEALCLARLSVVIFYFHSGLSGLDVGSPGDWGGPS